MRKLIIAIDGPAASGKSTTAKLVAQRLGYLHIDTGAMYRAVTLRVLEEKIPLDDVQKIGELAEGTQIRLERSGSGSRIYVDGRDVTTDIRSPSVTNCVSLVSSYRLVRDVLVREQRRMAERRGVVLEGRDIGTVVLPNADLKIYMVAHVTERVKRRKRDLELAGSVVDSEALEQQILERDRFDSTRDASPLRKAPDAIELDTTDLTIEQQVQFVVSRAQKILKRLS
ncbi:MAG: (d)CMP kinase [Ignavibacteria bacterium]|nr:(d)CMP kinase [Ignavibacteria bacterium]